jgi:H+/Cl- antiporter ClcA
MAGAIFAFEFAVLSKWNFKNLLFALIAAFVSDQIVSLWGVQHAHFLVKTMPEISLSTLFFTLTAALFFGLMSYLFVKSMKTVSSKINQFVVFPPLRPFFGGIALILLTSIIGNYNYLGLGVPLIELAFQEPAMFQVFFLKFVFTVATLASGFKGGEVTPLFFIGATLGSALSLILPLPTSMLAGLGLVAVFAGVTKTPFASSLIALELFGWEMFIWALPLCYISKLISGSYGIYSTDPPKNITQLERD